MKQSKKTMRAYDKRQSEYANMIARREGDHKARERMDTGGYKKPGSRNPKKARSG